MNPIGFLPDLLAQISTTSPWTLLLTKVTLLLAVAWVVHFTLTGANPRWRTLLWRGVVVGVALTGLWTIGLPGLEIRIRAHELVATIAPPLDQPLAAEPEPVGHLRVIEIPSHVPASVDARASPRQDLVEVRPETARPVESARLSLSWPVVLLGVWGLGVALLALRLAVAYVRLARLLRTSQAASEEIVAEVGPIAAALGCRRAVVVRSSRHYAVPFLYGLRRPFLVLPERMCRSAYREQLPGVIAHELAHVVSEDFAWNAALQVVSTILWFHPLAWRIGSAHRSACDAVCDAVSAFYLGDVQAYCQTLARSRWRARLCFPRPDWRWPAPATSAAESPCSRRECLRRPWVVARQSARC